jgi:hypothetical protein
MAIRKPSRVMSGTCLRRRRPPALKHYGTVEAPVEGHAVPIVARPFHHDPDKGFKDEHPKRAVRSANSG